MQPLKRFTQCGSLTMLFAVFIVLFGVSSTALTTFGKTNPNAQPTQGPLAKGRECSNHADCATLQSTSCVKDFLDAKLRCLCGDNSAPVNGQCSTSTQKGLHHMCKESAECEDNLICSSEIKPKNGTAKILTALRSKTTFECVCNEAEGYGYDLDKDTCDGSIMYAVEISFITLLSTILSYICSSGNFRMDQLH